MDFDKDVLCETIEEAFRNHNPPLSLDRALVRLIIDIGSDCFDLGYQAAKRETGENE